MKQIVTIVIFLSLLYISFKLIKKNNFHPNYKCGDIIDSFQNVNVYFNGGVGHTQGRNLTKDGYNLGIKYQCVEFVKRYYYEALNHKMPDSYGNAIDFFNFSLDDGELNKERNLIQYKNNSFSKPSVSDILILDKTLWNPYGHVAIIMNVTDQNITIIQQNSGVFSSTRDIYPLIEKDGKYKILNERILGWLRKESKKGTQ